jgi:putative DNA primase/helicase
VSLAQDDAKIAATIHQWNIGPWLLNTPGGTVDLRSGEMQEHRRDNFITKVTAVTPDKRPIFQWRKFLAEISDGDEELVAYLKRLAGYALTGQTDEHAFAFFYSTGGNGKSTFLKVLTGIVGEFHRVSPMTALLASKNEQHPTELAGLWGARLVTANETAQGRNWNEPLIKQLTGGDMITARFMQRDFFDFTPQFKLIITGNNKPGLRSVDEAVRRRIHLVPFTVTISQERRDRQLDAKLKTEWPGILQWMIEGCREWQEKGLARPKAVTEATDEYLESQDSIQAFVDERCVVNKREQEGSSALFASWTAFCENRGERPGHAKTFNDALEKKGFKREKAERGKVFRGLRLRKGDDDKAPEY